MFLFFFLNRKNDALFSDLAKGQSPKVLTLTTSFSMSSFTRLGFMGFDLYILIN